MAIAPARINSNALKRLIIPPIPIIGISTILEISKTFANATGFIAGPDSPALTLKIFAYKDDETHDH